MFVKTEFLTGPMARRGESGAADATKDHRDYAEAAYSQRPSCVAINSPAVSPGASRIAP